MSACPTCGATYEIGVKICPKDGTVLEGSAESVDTRVGQVLDGKYRLDATLGAGGMGTIYRATHLMLDKPVAVKLIKPELVTSPDLVRRFQREARAAGSLNHPNIAAAYDFGQTQDGTLYIAMELVDGPSLKDVIRSTGPIAFDRAVRIMRHVGSGLALAHRHNIIHRDLKPHNIMLATDGRHEVAKLLDFGIAKTFDEASTQLTQTGFVLGTPQYMSPEQAAGREIDGRSDLYSVGIILYEMLIGEVPFNDPSTPAVLVKHLTEAPAPPSRRRPDVAVSPELEVIALRLLEKDPAARFQSADEFLAALPADPGTVTAGTAVKAVATESDRTVVLPPPRSVGLSTPAGEATVVRPSPVAATLPLAPAQPSGAPAAAGYASTAAPTVPEQPALNVSAAAATSPASPATRVAGVPSAAPSPAPPAAAPPASPVVDPRVAQASASPAAREPRPMRDIILLVAVLLVVVGGVGFASMHLGFFGGTAEAPGAPAGLMSDVPAAAAAASPASVASTPASEPPAAAPLVSAASPAVVGTAAANAVPNAPAARTAPLPAVSSPGPAAVVAGRAPAAGAAIGPVVVPAPAAQAAAPAASAAPVIPESPAVFFRCTGDAQVCAALRSAMSDSLSRHSLRPITNQNAADVAVAATVATVDESTEQLFGTTFVIRTYSIEFEGQTTGGDVVPLPPASTLTFDARVGQQRLQDQSRTISMATASDVRAFWRARLGK